MLDCDSSCGKDAMRIQYPQETEPKLLPALKYEVSLRESLHFSFTFTRTEGSESKP